MNGAVESTSTDMIIPPLTLCEKEKSLSDVVELIRAGYDSQPYESLPFPQTSPAHLAAVAHLFGLSAPKVETARILELGCASGGNILPHALRYPKAHVVGIDLSPVQIAAGRKLVQALDLKNIELRQGDIAELCADLGVFDYIICHGVFSWVPDQVADAILRVAHENLAANGVAYISYNCYPGWKAKEIMRDAMILRGKGSGAEANPLGYARGMVDFLKSVVPDGSLLEHVLRDYGGVLEQSHDSYLTHEFLEMINQPLYFEQFVARAENVGLCYLAEASVDGMFVTNYGKEIAEPLLVECGDSQVKLEQYLDFVANRTFRQTLLVPGARAGDIRYRLDADRLKSLHIAAYLPKQCPGGSGTTAGDDAAFGPDGSPPVFLRTPAVIAVAKALTEEWPGNCSFAELMDIALQGADPGGDRVGAIEDELVQLIELLVIRGRARIRLEPVKIEQRNKSDQEAPAIPDLWRRYAAETGVTGRPMLVNASHEAVFLDPVEQCLVATLNQPTARGAMVDRVIALAGDGAISFYRGAGAVTDPEDVQACATEHVDRFLTHFPRRFF